MARRTFYSFHYGRDSMRAAQVRNHNAISNEDEVGVIDAAEWETLERQGNQAIKNWIQSQLQSTSVTAVLIGAETANRPWVRYEIVESWNRGNGIVGIRIHNVKDPRTGVDVSGRNPFDDITFADGTRLSACCKVYDWINDNGRGNMTQWVEEAAKERAAQSKYGKLPEFSPSSGISTSSPVARSVPSSFTPPARPTVIQNPPGQWAS